MLFLEQVLAVLLASSEVIPPVRKSTIFCGQSLIASDGRTCRRTEESAFAEVFGQYPLEILSVRWLSDSEIGRIRVLLQSGGSPNLSISCSPLSRTVRSRAECDR